MNNNQQHKSTIRPILEKIENDELAIRSKGYFRLKWIALIIVAVALCIVSIFLSSFILFTFRASGHASLVRFGLRGWEVFLLLFPWTLCVIEVLLIMSLEWLLRSFKFGYKVPVLYLFLGVFVVMICSGIVIDATTHFHERVLERERSNHLPRPFGNLYEGVRRPLVPPRGYDIFRGNILSIGTSSLNVVLEDPRNASTSERVLILFSPSFSTTSVTVGDTIFISGTLIDGTIKARNIRITVPHYD